MTVIKKLRLLSGLSQTKVAYAMGVNINTYRRKEANPGDMTITELKTFCEVIGCDLGHLISLYSLQK